MANGNVYAPLYNSVQARGRLSPLGAPGAIRPYEKKKSFGDKMASALGSMIDQASESNAASRAEQLAQMEVRYNELGKYLKKGHYEKAKGMSPGHPSGGGVEKWVWNDKKNTDPAPTSETWSEFFALEGQIGNLKGLPEYQSRKESIFDMTEFETVKPNAASFLSHFIPKN